MGIRRGEGLSRSGKARHNTSLLVPHPAMPGPESDLSDDDENLQERGDVTDVPGDGQKCVFHVGVIGRHRLQAFADVVEVLDFLQNGLERHGMR